MKIFWSEIQLASLEKVLLGGINGLGVKLLDCVCGGFSLGCRHAACVGVIRRQSLGHSSQALDTQPEQLRLVGLQMKQRGRKEIKTGITKQRHCGIR